MNTNIRTVDERCAVSRAGLLDCGHAPTVTDGVGTGSGCDASGRTFCYACAADLDRATMRETGRATLYLADGEVTNWPGSLRFPVREHRTSRNGGGFGCQRTDAWFHFEGYVWHAINRGDMQIARCRKTKMRVSP